MVAEGWGRVEREIENFPEKTQTPEWSTGGPDHATRHMDITVVGVQFQADGTHLVPCMHVDHRVNSVLGPALRKAGLETG